MQKHVFKNNTRRFYLADNVEDDVAIKTAAAVIGATIGAIIGWQKGGDFFDSVAELFIPDIDMD